MNKVYIKPDTIKIFSSTQFAIYKHVWILSGRDIAALDKHYIMQVTGRVLTAAINQQHEYQDSLTNDGSWWLVSWSGCGIQTVKNNPDAIFMLSFRQNKANNMYFVVIRKAYNNTPEAIARAMKYTEYRGSK